MALLKRFFASNFGTVYDGKYENFMVNFSYKNGLVINLIPVFGKVVTIKASDVYMYQIKEIRSSGIANIGIVLNNKETIFMVIVPKGLEVLQKMLKGKSYDELLSEIKESASRSGVSYEEIQQKMKSEQND